MLCNQEADLPVELCSHCKDAMMKDVNIRCKRCGLQIPEGQHSCGRCLQRTPVFDRCETILGYTLEAGHLIRQLKYNQKTNIANVMAYLMAEHLLQNREDLPEVIIPVPIHRKRLYRRGFNQTMEIAKGISTLLDLPIDYKSCQKTKSTVSQTNLSAFGRRNNLKGSFKMMKDIDYKHVAIFDDVMTTGATASELTRMLKAAGVETVEVWCCLRAD